MSLLIRNASKAVTRKVWWFIWAFQAKRESCVSQKVIVNGVLFTMLSMCTIQDLCVTQTNTSISKIIFSAYSRWR